MTQIVREFDARTGLITERPALDSEIPGADVLLPAPPAPAVVARAQRNAFLAASDWTQLADSPLSPEARAAWTAYRAALRDVPQQAAFPDAIDWPMPPGASTPAET